MKSILIDVDEVICYNGFLPLLNKFLGTNYRLDDFTTYYIDDVIGSDEKKAKFYKLLEIVDLYENVEFLPGSIETIEKLSKQYEILICSACAMFCCLEKSGKFFKDKYNFLIKHFPFLDPNKFILTGEKNIFRADVQIDDRVQNLQGDIPVKLLMTSYHNKNFSDAELKKQGIIRVNSWKEIEKVLLCNR